MSLINLTDAAQSKIKDLILNQNGYMVLKANNTDGANTYSFDHLTKINDSDIPVDFNNLTIYLRGDTFKPFRLQIDHTEARGFMIQLAT